MILPEYKDRITRLKNKYRGKPLQRFGAGFERWVARKLLEWGAFVMRHTRSQFPDLAAFHDGHAAFFGMQDLPAGRINEAAIDGSMQAVQDTGIYSISGQSWWSEEREGGRLELSGS